MAAPVDKRLDKSAYPPHADGDSNERAAPSLALFAEHDKKQSASWRSKDSTGGMSTGSSDGHYRAVLHKQASELESALTAHSNLEYEIATQLGALGNADVFGTGGLDSAEMMDLRAERDALQDALKTAQLELAKEQAARVSAETKASAMGVSHPLTAGRRAEESKEIQALKDQLEAEQTEVLALQESLRRAEQECSTTHKQALALREEMSMAQSKLSEAEAEIEQFSDRAKHLERLVETKDKTIKELTERVEKRVMETMQFNGSGKIGEEDMWKLGLTHEQLSAIDHIIMKWRDGYTRKDHELLEVTKSTRECEEQLSRITGIVRRTMESIRAGYQRRSAEDPSSNIRGDTHDRDEALLDTNHFDNVEDMLGSLAQFAANKSHTVLRLQQELHRRAEEISQLEDEVQRSWSASQKEAELGHLTHELADKTAEAAELRISLGRKAEEAAAAIVEVRVLHEELSAGKDTMQRLRNQLSAAEADAARVKQEASHMAVQDVSRMREELERAHAEVVPLKEQLNRRTREVRELNHMLKAWEAMRLGKDAQIASLMERCKRHEEEAAEKARSVDSLRRKLALAGRDPLLSSTGGASSSRSRHIHVHMHHQPSEASSEYEVGSMTPGSLRNSQGF